MLESTQERTDPAQATTSPSLEMIDVTIGSLVDAEAVVLEHVNWKVAAGEFWAIGGLQASGKSDFMATAAGIMPPLHGVFRIFGQELGAGFRHELLPTRLRLGLVFDGGRPLNHLTVAENVALPIRYHRNLSLEEAESQTQALLEFTGLLDCADQTPGTMRRNLQQRIGLARALALKPEVLLLDGPLNGLDPRESVWWLEMLERLRAGDPILDGHALTLVVSGDNLRPWRERAQQFALLKNQEFIVIGGRSELNASPEPLLRELFRADLLNL